MNIKNLKWHAVVTPPSNVKEVTVVLIPERTRKLMSETSAHDVYLWSKHHKVVKRLPRKIKKCLYYGSSHRLFVRSGVALIKMWNEYECNRNLD